ncbi:MAG: phospholipid carrier-dependent glycosyltransferase [Desulfobacterales bacterium]|uniref:Phospholipid carrier-dependent glycosyltransferase n=1 Tax=Candidatus Desulfatibia vada TaxID=2841696 RepID=A0A8J6TRB8_9BACT|nr:phospholipid carrier-dependent glycosyltransferase [Candidatus Desulfatibia vada]
MNHKILNIITGFLLWSTILVFISIIIILNLTPPILRDALIHHLAVPKLWLRHGGFHEIPWAEYSYYPMYINLLYLICLYFKNDIAPKFIHFGFGLATGGMIYFYLKQKFDYRWGLLGMVIFITTPIVVWLSTSAYIDLGMTFFTTGSMLAFVRWRDSAYKKIKWLFVSSLCMGIAIGSKYNALIAFMAISLILIFMYVRETGKQATALKYGMLFFAVATLAASPWYIKNYLLTDNPFYPLFNSFFQSLHHQPMSEVLHRQAIQKVSQVSFFRMREIMFGETLWETLTIPIRMFFQGEDNSYQYFQGVLNPILIVFWPFVLLDKENGKDKAIFSFFVVFFMLVAFFLTRKQVRYLMPVMPFLAILAVMGIKNLADRFKEGWLLSLFKFKKSAGLIPVLFLFAAVIILLSFNGLYLKNRVDTIKPFPFVLQQETREAFLRRHLKHLPAVEYLNAHLPDDATVFTMFLGRRGYYLDRSYKNEHSFGMSTIRRMVDSSVDAEKFAEYVRSINVTHILMRTDLVDNFLKNNFSQQEIMRFMNLANKYWKRIYEKDGYAVWDTQAR